MGEYKMAKRFYDNESDFGDKINRDKLLKEMYEVSGSISKMIKQCESVLLDEVMEERSEKKKALIWLKEVWNENAWKGSYESPKSILLESMNEYISREMNEVESLV